MDPVDALIQCVVESFEEEHRHLDALHARSSSAGAATAIRASRASLLRVRERIVVKGRRIQPAIDRGEAQ